MIAPNKLNKTGHNLYFYPVLSTFYTRQHSKRYIKAFGTVWSGMGWTDHSRVLYRPFPRSLAARVSA
jgi:hypothetical protein